MSQVHVFKVKLRDETCTEKVRKVLDPLPGVKFIEFDIDNQRAFVTSSISSDEMFAALQTTKKDCSYLGRCQVRAFRVKLRNETCTEKVRKVLDPLPGVIKIEFDIENQWAFVTTWLSGEEILASLQTTKKDCSYLGVYQIHVFQVKLRNETCTEKVRKVLDPLPGVTNIEFDIENQWAFVTSWMSGEEILASLQTTKKDCSYLGVSQIHIFQVKLRNETCTEKVKKALDPLPGVRNIEFDIENQRAFVTSWMTSDELFVALQTTKKEKCAYLGLKH